MLESWVKEVGEGIEMEADRSLNMLDMVVVVQQRAGDASHPWQKKARIACKKSYVPIGSSQNRSIQAFFILITAIMRRDKISDYAQARSYGWARWLLPVVMVAISFL
jgi:hypothetical protein